MNGWMKMRPSRVFFHLLLWAGIQGCGLARSPGGVFDSYIEAYAVGDVERLWLLSSPAAQRDAERVKRDLLKGLNHPEVPRRVFFEGTFGVTADIIEPMNQQQFFYWAVALVRRRLGVGFIRSTIRRIARVRIVDLGPGKKVVVYRQGESLARLLLDEVEPNVWRVDQSPFLPDLSQGKSKPTNEKDPASGESSTISGEE